MLRKISGCILLITPWTKYLSSTALFAVTPNRTHTPCDALKRVISLDLLPLQYLIVYSKGFWGLVAIQMSCEKHGELYQHSVTKSCGLWFFQSHSPQHRLHKAVRNWWVSNWTLVTAAYLLYSEFVLDNILVYHPNKNEVQIALFTTSGRQALIWF